LVSQFFPNNNITRRKAHAGLHLDTTTSGSGYPFLFADCNPDAEFLNQIGQWDSCHENVHYGDNVIDEEAAATSKELVDKIHSQLLLNFVDVVCPFADDLGGPGAVVHRLMRWIQYLGDSHWFPSHKPGVVVIASGSQACRTLSAMESTYGFRETFSPLTVVDTTVSACQSELAAHTSLKGILTRKADTIRNCRAELRTLYTAAHIEAFFVEAVKVT
jgi:hypothetical protein